MKTRITRLVILLLRFLAGAFVTALLVQCTPWRLQVERLIAVLVPLALVLFTESMGGKFGFARSSWKRLLFIVPEASLLIVVGLFANHLFEQLDHPLPLEGVVPKEEAEQGIVEVSSSGCKCYGGSCAGDCFRNWSITQRMPKERFDLFLSKGRDRPQTLQMGPGWIAAYNQTTGIATFTSGQPLCIY